MTLYLVFWLVFGAVALFLVGVSRRKREKHWLELRRSGPAFPEAEAEEGRYSGPFSGIVREAEEAGLEVTAGQVMSVFLAGLIGGAVIMYAATGTVVFTVLGGLFGFILPRWWVRRKVEGRSRAFEEQLEKGLMAVCASLHAGSNTVQALGEAARQAGPPLRDVLLEAMRYMQTGDTLQEALAKAGRRVRSRDMEIVTAAITVNLRTGARLADVLEQVADSVRERRAFRAQVRAKCSQAAMAGNVLALVPFAFLCVFRLMNPEYLRPLTAAAEGNVVMAFAFGMFFLGWLIVRRMLDVEVE